MEGVTPYKKMELHAEFDSYKEFELVLEVYLVKRVHPF
jgi:hypothetical protein